MPIHRLLRLSLVLALAIIVASITTETPYAAEETSVVPDFRHVRVENPASLSNEDAERIYQQISRRLASAYEASKTPQLQGYLNWKRYNTIPYLSSTHGNRYINNYANDASVGYDQLSKGSVMPVGAVLAKDSFAVSQNGDVMAGRLYLMEKLYAGSSPSTSDWRYMMIETDGTVIADTTGSTSAQAEFCHTCHKVRSSKDFLFFVPPDFRVGN